MVGDEIADALAEIRAVTAQVRQATDESRAALAQQKKDDAPVEAAMEKERRAGTHGRDWQILQERIDMKRTTLDDILMGVDHSAEAEAVRRQAEKGLVEGRAVALAAIGEEDQTGQLDDLKRAQAELARVVAQLEQLGQFRGDL